MTDTVQSAGASGSARTPGIEEIDLAIAVAHVALGVARSAEARCPSAENAERVAQAAAAVDALLDQRIAAA